MKREAPYHCGGLSFIALVVKYSHIFGDVYRKIGIICWTGCLQNSGKQNKGQGFVGAVFPKSQNGYRDGMTGITSGTVFSHNPKIPLLIEYFG